MTEVARTLAYMASEYVLWIMLAVEYRWHLLESTVARYQWIAKTRSRTEFIKHVVWKHKMNQTDIQRAFHRWTAASTHELVKPEPTPQAATLVSGLRPAVHAAMDLTDSSKCPYCKGAMRKSQAAGHAVYVCDSDRHVTPVENAKLS